MPSASLEVFSARVQAAFSLEKTADFTSD